MNNYKNYICASAILIGDVIAWAISYLLQENKELDFNNLLFLIFSWVIWVFLIKKGYFQRMQFWAELKMLLQSVMLFMILVGVAQFSEGLVWRYEGFPIWGIYLALLLPINRSLMRRTLRIIKIWDQPTIIFGSGENAKQAALALESEHSMGCAIKAYVMPKSTKHEEIQNIKYLEWPDSIDDFKIFRKYHCIVALEHHEADLRDQLMSQLSQHKIKMVSVVPAMRGVPLFGHQTTQFFSHELLMISVNNNLLSAAHRSAKRVFDIVGATVLIILISPIMLWIAYKIWRSDGFPIIFSQPRVGKELKSFKFYKFRSMVNSAESMLKKWEENESAEWKEYTANNFKLENDSRLISIGAMIRRTSMDELPQLFNVLRGDMSLVGPRPLLLREQNEYGNDLSLYALTPPGMTGLWQISGRSQTTFEDRVAFDIWYVKNWSIWIDVIILFKTLKVVFRRDGAY